MTFIRQNILSLLFVLSAYYVSGQQDPHFNQIFFNPMCVNPGYAGSQDMFSFSAINKMQWLGFGEGAPMSTAVNINVPIAPFGFKSGVGLNVVDDRYGFNSNVGVSFSYAARFKFKLGGTLAVGVNGGIINSSVKPKWVFPSTSSDVQVPQQDASAVSVDFGLGVFYNTEKMFFGISSTHLNEAKMYKNLEKVKYKRQFYVIGGYVVDFPNNTWQFEPSVIIGTDIATSRFSINSILKYNKKFWGGVSYRIGEAVVGMVGFELFNGLKIGYAYEFSTGKINSYNSGSHEFMLGYNFALKREKPPQQYKSLRFL